jgi:hypothetical protein
MGRTKQTVRRLTRKSIAETKLKLPKKSIPKKRKANHLEPLEDLFKEKEVISLISSDEEKEPTNNDNRDKVKKELPIDDGNSDLEYFSASSSMGSPISLTDLK